MCVCVRALDEAPFLSVLFPMRRNTTHFIIIYLNFYFIRKFDSLRVAGSRQHHSTRQMVTLVIRGSIKWDSTSVVRGTHFPQKFFRSFSFINIAVRKLFLPLSLSLSLSLSVCVSVFYEFVWWHLNDSEMKFQMKLEDFCG